MFSGVFAPTLPKLHPVRQVTEKWKSRVTNRLLVWKRRNKTVNKKTIPKDGFWGVMWPITLSDLLVTIHGTGTQLLFNTKQLVVLGHTVGAAQRTGLDLAGIGGYRDVGDRSIFGLSGTV